MKTWLVLTMMMVCGVGAAEAGNLVYTAWLSKTAVGGYDTVSFFREGGPVKGQKEHAFEYQGAVWLFASRENLDEFRADPARYAPQYGGHCAWAAAQNELAPGDPKYWSIIDGKLYLNYSRKVQVDWEKDIPGFIQKANQFWPELSK